MKNLKKYSLLAFAAFVFLSCSEHAAGKSSSGLVMFLPFTLLIIVVLLSAIFSKKDLAPTISETQINKVINITLPGGLIGLFGLSPKNSLNVRIKKENEDGWKVVQIIPASSGNVMLYFLRLLLLILTLFIYTTQNGYYVLMERSDAIN
ncbi:MAG: hypothetical protein JXB17_08820 [Bacteroidales bacterium]|nr:hypothetical protein [Bacteroidales bacterium]